MFTTLVDLANIYTTLKTEFKNIESKLSYGHLKLKNSVGDAPEALQDTIDDEPRPN